jgi:hypothetical protein
MAELLDGQPLFPGESDIDQLYILQRLLGEGGGVRGGRGRGGAGEEPGRGGTGRGKGACD